LAAPEFVFVGGAGRTGTGVLRRALARHGKVAAFDRELRFIADPDGLVDFYKVFCEGWSPYAYDLAIRRLEAILGEFTAVSRIAPWLRMFRIDNLFRHSILPRYPTYDLTRQSPKFRAHIEALLDDLTDYRFDGSWEGLPRMQERSFRTAPALRHDEIARRIMQFVWAISAEIRSAKHATKLLDGNDWNHLSFVDIREIFPDSLLVHIYRDPRDTVASFMEQRWAPSDPEAAARYFATLTNHWWEVRDRLPDGSFIEVGLEELADRTDSTLREVCGFLNIDWDPAVLEEDVSRPNKGRWQRDIPEVAQPAVLDILKPYLKSMGYAA
jgi:hypothetical protein